MKLEQNALRTATGRPPKGAPTPGSGLGSPRDLELPRPGSDESRNLAPAEWNREGRANASQPWCAIETLQAAEDRIGKALRDSPWNAHCRRAVQGDVAALDGLYEGDYIERCPSLERAQVGLVSA